MFIFTLSNITWNISRSRSLLSLHQLLQPRFLLLCSQGFRKICWRICHRTSLTTLSRPCFPFCIRSSGLTKLLIELPWKEVDNLRCKVDELLSSDWIHYDVKTSEALLLQKYIQLPLEILQNQFILLQDHSTSDHTEVHHEEFLETCSDPKSVQQIQ